MTESKLVAKIGQELKAAEEEFEVARKIQEKLFPPSAPKIPGFDIAGVTHPAVSTGGDYYDYIHMPDGTLVLVVGDVSGHGFGPALLMASARAYLHALTRIHSDTDKILSVANELVASDTSDADFITLIVARLDPARRSFNYASAGHEICYLFDNQGRVKTSLESTGPPLGVILNTEFASSVDVPLEAGDMILLLTDGIVEAESAEGLPFGRERTIDIVRKHRRKPASEILDHIHRSVRKHIGPQTAEIDDITATIVKVWPD
jgi:serine phosphatase RsbU (regulator of sigma subunit)